MRKAKKEKLRNQSPVSLPMIEFVLIVKRGVYCKISLCKTIGTQKQKI